VPELPEVESVRLLLAPALVGARFEEVLVRRANLRIPFPAAFEDRLVGHHVVALERRAKYLLGVLSSGETLVIHLGMTGWFRIEGHGRAGSPEFESGNDPRHDHVVFRMSSGAVVTFNDPRRFGLMDLVPVGATHGAVGLLGPEPLSAAFDAGVLAAAARGRATPLKALLLDQRVVAGLGNIYVSEALWVARLSPRRRAATIATPGGAPRPTAVRLAAAIVEVLQRAIRGIDRFRVYDREGRRCPRRACGGTIRRIVQAGRSTFYCPVCQR
jgi:formamidopyrimidine-DNA glycosylase